MLTFCIDPVGIEVGNDGLVTDLFEGLGRLVMDLEDATRSPASACSVRHGSVRGAATWRGVGSRVVGDGARDEDW